MLQIINPKIIFTIPPASSIHILFGMLFLLYALSSSTGSSSPSIFTNPPIGINFSSYEVSFPCFFQIVGPNPIANCFILTLNNFATRKWPSSCINIKKPNKIAIFKNPIIIFSPFYYNN